MAAQAGGRVSRARPGFTLLEIGVGLGVAAVVLGLAVPLYLGYLARRELQNAAFLLQGDLRLAQQTAIAQSGDGPRVEVCFLPGDASSGTNPRYEVYKVLFTSEADRTDAAEGPLIKAARAGGEYRVGVAMTLEPAGTTCLASETGTAIGFAGSGAALAAGMSPISTRQSVRIEYRGRALYVDLEPGSGLATVRQ